MSNKDREKEQLCELINDCINELEFKKSFQLDHTNTAKRLTRLYKKLNNMEVNKNVQR